jgi:hypothetical protein
LGERELNEEHSLMSPFISLSPLGERELNEEHSLMSPFISLSPIGGEGRVRGQTENS